MIRRKKGIFLMIAMAVAASIGGISTAVYSSTESKVAIRMNNGNVWECKDDFKSNWYVNVAKKENNVCKQVNFQVDLSKYYNDRKVNLAEPFTVKLNTVDANNNKVDITGGSNIQIVKDSNKDGVFNVTFDVTSNLQDNNLIEAEVGFDRGNSWGIEAQKQHFYFIVDNTKPILNILNYNDVNNKEITDTVNLNCQFTENNVDKLVVAGTYKQDTSELGQCINDVFFRDNNNTKGEYASLERGDRNDNFILNFDKPGIYDVTMTLYDKSGVSSESTHVKFQRTVEDIEFKFKDTKLVEKYNTYYCKNSNISVELLKILMWKCILGETVNYSISEDNNAISNSGDINVNNGDIVCSKDGRYDLTFYFTKIKSGGQNQPENKFFNFVIDTKAPEFKAKVSGNDIKFTDNKAYLQNGQNIELSLSDDNINEDSRSIKVYKDGKELANSKEANMNFSARDEGKYTVEVYAEDYATNNISQTYELYVDTQDPDVKINGVSDEAKYKQDDTPKVKISAADKNYKMGKAIITRESKGQEPSIKEIPLENNKEIEENITENGKYTIEVYAEDYSGRKSDKIIKFERDAKAPELIIKKDDRELSEEELNEYNMPYIKNEKGIKIDAEVNEDYPKLNADGTVDEKATYIKVKKTSVTQNGEETVKDGNEEYFIGSKSLNFTEDGKYEVTIYSIDNCGNESERKLYFVLDGTKPELTIRNREDYYNHVPDMEIGSKDAFQEGGVITIKYQKVVKQLNGEDIVGNQEEKNIEIESKDQIIKMSDLDEFKEEAEYRISSITATDRAGNVSEEKDIKYNFDTNPPVKCIEGLDDDVKYYNTDRNITINTEDINLDIAELTIFKDGEVYEPTEEETVQAFTREDRKAYASYNFTTDGEYKIVLNSSDKAGNGKDEVLEKEFVIDKTMPVISIDDFDALNGKYINYNKSLTVRINEKYLDERLEEDTESEDYENSTKVNVVKRYSNGTVESKDYEFNLNGECPDYANLYNEFTDDAQYTVTVTARDKAGNVSKSEPLIFTVDKTLPIQSITGVENDAYYNVDKDVEFLSTDANQDINTVTVTRDGEPYSIGEFTLDGFNAVLNHTFSMEGTYDITFITTDKAGNSVTSTIKFTIDKTAPQIKAIKGDDGSELKFGEYINRIFRPEFVLDNSEDFITQVTLNGADVTGNVSMASQEMEYNYTVTAQDKAGNVTTFDTMFTVDTTNPEIKISGIMSGFFNEDITPEFDITDTNLDYANTSSTLNGEAFTSGTTIDSQNDFNLKLVGTDLATNSNSQSISFTIDKDGPVISFKNPISGKYFTEDFIPEFLIEDLSDYTIIALTLDGEEYNIGDVIEEEGKHVLYIEVMDKAGNTSELTVEFILDKTAPKFIIDGVQDGETYYDATSATVMLDNPLDKINSITVNGESADGEVSEEYGQQVIKINFNDVNDYELILTGTDDAGNNTVQTVKFAVAEKTLLSKVTTNKKLLYSSLAAVTALLTLGVGRFAIKRKNSLKTISNIEDSDIEE